MTLPENYDAWKTACPPDYDYSNYECAMCGGFGEELTDDLCIVCYEEQQAEEGEV